MPIVLTAAFTFNTILPFFNAHAQDSVISKRVPLQEQAETPKKLTPAQQTANTINAIKKDVFYRLMAEPVLATLPRKEISNLLDALFSKRRTPIVLNLSKTMYGENGLRMLGPDGQDAMRGRTELQNALLRLSSYVLFEWGIDRLDMVVTEPAGASHFQIFIDRSEPFPTDKQFIKAAKTNGLLK